MTGVEGRSARSFAGRIVEAAGVATLLAVVAVAFADSSIVVLALPELLGEFGVSIASVAWVVTSYNLVLALAALALVRVGPPFRPRRAAAIGTTIFALA